MKSGSIETADLVILALGVPPEIQKVQVYVREMIDHIREHSLDEKSESLPAEVDKQVKRTWLTGDDQIPGDSGILQDMVQIDQAIEQDTFFENKALLGAVTAARGLEHTTSRKAVSRIIVSDLHSINSRTFSRGILEMSLMH